MIPDNKGSLPAKNGEMFGDPDSPDRYLSPAESANLKAGSNHYRAYVGPPNRFDFMAGTQFSLMFHMGLRGHHKVLDFGCGSLRFGRLLIPYLQKGGYFGIEPNDWLISDGIERELGNSIIDVKAPRFSNNTDFNCNVFDEKFDFIIAQSIITHTGLDLFDKFLKTAKQALKPDGIILFTYIPTQDLSLGLPVDGWHYPECVRYTSDIVMQRVRASRLVGKPLPWFHTVSVWFCAANDARQLPAENVLHHLSGGILRSDQFEASLKYSANVNVTQRAE